MATSLTPTTVTDKNGRVTTVHKRQDAHGPSKPLSVPAPTLAPQPSRSTAGTPLTTPPPLTEDQQEEFRAWQREIVQSYGYNKRAQVDAARPLDPESEALAWRVLKSGRVNPQAVASLVNESQLDRYMFRHRDHNPSELQAKLRVAERVGEINPAVSDLADRGFGVRIGQCVDGYGYSPSEMNRTSLREITTEEELAAVAAVSAFVVYATNEGLTGQLKEGEYKDSEGRRNNGTWMTNHRLKAFLQENPDDVNRVIEYVGSRSVGTTAKETREIIQYVQESKELGVLDQGWL